ncbi:6-carboxytetrahydropterin synthase [Sphingomonas ginsenosidivorax]|nr:6-carboxytetrahydropterin synthase [Sphingomonas ginsenosidivorax]
MDSPQARLDDARGDGGNGRLPIVELPMPGAMPRTTNAHDATTWHLISREIGIDAGHRVMDHGSKCHNLHGHRYRIEAWCRGPLFAAGEQNGMVLDFGFLKDEMMHAIDARFDHAFMLCVDDPLCRAMFGLDDGALSHRVAAAVSEDGLFLGHGRDGMQICVLAVVPTAENLAKLWFDLLAPRVVARTSGQASLVCLKVWETPNCWASYGPVIPG